MIRVGLVGCGLIGKRRAEVAASNSRTSLVCVADVDPEAARATADVHSAEVADDWGTLVERQDLDLVVVATPNKYLCEVAVAALESGKHVLIEKPMGRSLVEARKIAEAAQRSARLLKVGFNHRYHPAVARAHELVAENALGKVINARVVYGHGGRAGYEKEWRGNLELAGGGEALDQGVHVFDLLHWFVGVPKQVFARTQTAAWPIAPLEDNAFGLLAYDGGEMAAFHTSWTQWKNRFLFEVFGTRGSVSVDGLGGSYGTERLIQAVRRPGGGAPNVEEHKFTGLDRSWELEWAEFVAAIERGSSYMGGREDGMVAMATLDAVYRSARSGVAESLPGTHAEGVQVQLPPLGR